jgi:hypothetical protein
MSISQFVFFALLVTTVPSTLGATTIIDFEGRGDSEVVTNQYPGVTFSDAIILTAGISLNEFEFPPHSGTNVASDNSGPMAIIFSSPIQTFGGYFTYGQALTLQAFGNGDNLLASMTSAFFNNEALSGVAGSGPNELLQVSSSSGISRITITGDPAGGSFALDDASYSASETAVPEPATLPFASAITALSILSHFLRRRLRFFHTKSKHGMARRKARRILSGMVGSTLVFFFDVARVPAATSLVGTPTASPSSLTVGANTPVSFTAQITDPSLIEDSVLVVQVNAAGTITAILCQLNDKGAGGDVMAGDKIFTGVTAIPESVIGTVKVQVSAAFRGHLRRDLSNAVSLTVAAPQTLKDPTTGVQITVPNFGSPPQLAFTQPAGEYPLLEIKVTDPKAKSINTAFGISLIPNNSRATLQAWFSQNVDPDGILIANETFVERNLPNGSSAMLLMGTIPAAYLDGPVDDGYLMSPTGDTVVIITTSQVDPLPSLGYSADQVREIARQILLSVQM